jgi:UDP-N-acetylmuramoyl-L-alanyl-D-glutamate--2,6-diaminopimelate ligase
LKLVGVTGTNGKTTIATLLYKTFRTLGYPAGLLSTVANYVNDEEFPTTHTTLEPIQLNRLLRKMVDDGCGYAFMEVSSHAIHQHRVHGLKFAGAIFSNLTQDHLDYHGDMLTYRNVKKELFDGLPADAFAITNIDDKNGNVMLQNCNATKYSYSVKNLADFKARIFEKHFDGTDIEINGKELTVQFVGVFNVYNLLSVYGASVLLGLSEEEVLRALTVLQPVAGRFQTIRSPKGITAINSGTEICVIFEGFMDYLSYLTLKHQQHPKTDIVVLNSVALLDKAMDFLNSHTVIHAFLDNDEAGKLALTKIQNSCKNVFDQSGFNKNHRDLNSFLCD